MALQEIYDFSLFPLNAATCLVYTSTLKVEVICSPELSFNFQRTAVLYAAEEIFITTAVRLSNPASS
jgi:hypothetical protein